MFVELTGCVPGKATSKRATWELGESLLDAAAPAEYQHCLCRFASGPVYLRRVCTPYSTARESQCRRSSPISPASDPCSSLSSFQIWTLQQHVSSLLSLLHPSVAFVVVRYLMSMPRCGKFVDCVVKSARTATVPERFDAAFHSEGIVDIGCVMAEKLL